MKTADILIENARVLTMDPKTPHAEALAIAGSRILAVGTREAVSILAGPDTRRIDAQGGTVMPGMVEAHLHLFAGAFGLRLLQLDGVQGLPAVRDKLQAYAQANPDEALLICKATDYNLFGEGVQTTRQMLDEALADRPVICIAHDHHTAWANSIAIERAGLMQGREMPPGNEVVMAGDGTALGELREHAAFDPVMALRSSGGRESLGLAGLEPGSVTPEQRAADIAVLEEGLKLCASYGFTALHNMDGNRYQLELLAEIEAKGGLICRVEVPFHLTPEKDLSTIEEASRFAEEFDTDKLKSKRVKMFMDGVIDGATAVMVEDYADQPGWRGEPLHSAERFNAAAVEIDRRGLQISVHAIGDGAVRRVLDGYEAAQKANGPRDSRHRIEHVELLHPDDLKRFAELGVVASMQPPHPPGAMDFPKEPWVSRVGEARWPWGFPLAALRAEGVPICFASDWPVADLNPMRGVKAAMTREPWGPMDPDNRCSLMEALHGYTAGGAHAGHDEHRFGRLAPGMLADIVVMDRDLEAEPVESIDQARAMLTLCDGEVTWEA
ncbi:amidohydrolase [Marinibacterium profundimaris]|uniref:Hydrolase n=1 Tax=Marinibacterium profundimaris TaxID=1679460 RepID=A0A225NSR7_9RHOB|nr:amidohydrolase [Marinibacterium profundimaris]OWU76067.1 hydrolase [Marinibacterium profundimaris]